MASSDPNKKPSPKSDKERLSLHGMTPEEALKKALSTPPPKDEKRRDQQAKDGDNT